ncbi:hypothetical protein TanjilG_26205 [Lupinus angustifolius]|uniref:WD repeat-containing protein 76 n=1 Tax=Lupinus angustifolius TaxID=3871 RepID=A0A4P1R248_LUPAN|nr:PREDICTED: WD repeat-containing protein 76 [Lupinus angustifolius]OIV99867.1 hypothetical protein TanjilG_26205 [Lupinus angustifolius]
MASQNLTDYERKRLNNIRRNNEMMAALKLHSKATQLSKRPRVATKSSPNSKSETKKPKIETPLVIRRSLRTRGIPPITLDSVDSNPSPNKSSIKIETSVKNLGPLAMSDTYDSTHSDRSFIESIVGMAKKEASNSSVGVLCDVEENKKNGSFKLESMSLEYENIARVVPGRITDVRFFPSSSLRMIVVGNKFGNIGFWNIGDTDDTNAEPQVYLYHPHSAPISGILVQENCLSKIYTSCYDGLIRLMDAEKEVFDLVFNSEECIYSLSQPKNDSNCLYFGEGRGGLTLWDNRIGKSQSQWVLHEDRINTIDFNCENPQVVATSSSDGTACTWDLRYTDMDKMTALKTFTHKRALQSAYFSPSGRNMATTSMDNTIGIYSGVNLEDSASIYHDNQTGRWISSFRAIWGWDDSYLFVGNMKRGVDVVSAIENKQVTTLQSTYISAIPCRFDAHPYEVGTLAGATSGGQVYIWTLR